MVMFINAKLVDTKHAYQLEAKGNLKELKALMEKRVVKETPTDDNVFKPTKTGGSAWTYEEKKKARTFKL
jgi:hypothetical protein